MNDSSLGVLGCIGLVLWAVEKLAASNRNTFREAAWST
jgi:hypothetical protein